MKVPFEIERSRENLTARGGLYLFKEFNDRLKVEKTIEKHFPKPLSNKGYKASCFMNALLLTLYGGGESIAHTREIRDDKALRKLLNLKKVPSESAIGDWLKRIGEREGINSIEQVNDDILRRILKCQGIEEVSIIIDPTLIKGNKQEAKMTYAGYKGFRPAIAFINELNLIVHHEFKEGNDNGGRLRIIKQTVEKLKSWGIKVRFVLADSEYYTADVLNYLEQLGIEYAIACSKDASTMEDINNIPQEAWEKFITEDDICTKQMIAETVHLMNQSNPFRLIVKRSENKKNETCYHCVATNMSNKNASEVAHIYAKRANQENTIKEAKNGFGVRKVPSGDFKANALFFGAAVLAHNLFVAQKLFTMPKGYQSKTIKIIRWLFVEIPGKVVTYAKKMTLKIDCSIEKYNMIIEMRRRTHALKIP